MSQKNMPGHLTGCGGADPHSSLTSASSASSAHFPTLNRKKRSCFIIAINQLLTILTTLFILRQFFSEKGDETTLIRSQTILNLQAFLASFRDGPGD